VAALLALGCGAGAERSTLGAANPAPEGVQATGSPPDAGNYHGADQAVASGTARPDQDGNGILDTADLEEVLVRWESGGAARTEVNDVLAMLYWGEQVSEDALLEVLQRHHYGDDWSALVGSLRANTLASYATAADGGTSDGEHSVRDSGLHQRYFSSQYDPTGGHAYDVSRNHDLYISRSWNHTEAQSRITGDPIIGGHWSSTSSTWPSNHDRTVSRSFPGDHTEATSRSWPPGHQGDNSKGWKPTDHTTSVSRAWPPNHSIAASAAGKDLHLTFTSSQYPNSHKPEISRSHSFNISNSWPNFPEAHSVVASHTRPSNHFEAVSNSWPKDHAANISSNWPPNHYDGVSKTWPSDDPGVHSSGWSKLFPPKHTYFTSVKDTVGIIKDIKGAVMPTKPDAGK